VSTKTVVRWRCGGPHQQHPAGLEPQEHHGGAAYGRQICLNNVSRGHLVDGMLQLEVEHDFVRWTESFMSERKVRLITNGQEREDYRGQHRHPTRTPQLHPSYLSKQATR